jgi:hypothetical protein
MKIGVILHAGIPLLLYQLYVYLTVQNFGPVAACVPGIHDS